MSFEFQGRVYTASKTKQSQRLLLLTLAYHADKYGVCWPSIETLAGEINATPRNTNALLSKLKTTGEIVVVEGGGRNLSNTYIIALGQSENDIRGIFATHHRFEQNKNPVDSDRVCDEINPVDSSINPVDSSINPVDSSINPVDIDRRTNMNLQRTDKELTTTTCAVVDDDDQNLFPDLEIDPDLVKCQTAYKNNIGPLGPLQIDDFSDLYNGLSPPPTETRLEWFEYAILAAASNGSNRWSYVKSVIEGISQSGDLQRHKEKWNGQAKRTPAGHSSAKNGQGKMGDRQQQTPSYRPPGDTDATGRDAATNSRLRSLFGR